MIYKVWDEKCKDDNDEEICYFKLMQEEIGINVTAVDKEGNKLEGGNIIFLHSPLRCLIMQSDIGDDIPIKTNFYSEAIIVNSNDYESFIREERMHHFVKSIVEENKTETKKTTIQ